MALESYSLHLEPSFVQIALPSKRDGKPVPPTFDLSPSYAKALDHEFSRVYEEYTRRITFVQTLSEEIVNLWAELGTPQAQTDILIVKHCREAPEQLGLHESDMRSLQSKRDKLVEEKQIRESRLKELKLTVESLWDRLGVEEPERRRFLAGNRGCGLRVINEFEAELDRLNELKRANLHLFIEDARFRLQELWDSLYFSEEEMLEFTPAFSDVHSEALLSAHEGEIARLEALKHQRGPILQTIEKYRSLVKDRDDLATSSQDASRLMAKGSKGEKRDPTRLLREEKIRKRITKELPKVEAELRKALQRWEDDYGRPFLVYGQRYLDELVRAYQSSLPPRSKTPSTFSAPPKSTKPVTASSSYGSSAKGAPPSHSNPKPPGVMLSRNVFASSISRPGGTSPSKIPARVPLSSMRNGNNSPERRLGPVTIPKSTTTSSMGPPARAPPPKMRDLAPSGTPTSHYDRDDFRCASVASSFENAIVRQVIPEDIYHDRKPGPYVCSSIGLSRQDAPHRHRDIQASANYISHHREQEDHVPHPEARQISTTSVSASAISGSENWETYDDASEPEMDASDPYHAKVKAASAKRYSPEGGHSPKYGGMDKKFKDEHTATMGNGAYGNTNTYSARDAEWTDENMF